MPIWYPVLVSFDIARAVSETFGSRTPLLDRVLSYLFFADVAVVEQSTADEWGSGVTLIGLKGRAEYETGLVLAGAIPTLAFFPESPQALAETQAHPRDLHRLVDLLARVFALSVLDPDTIHARLALVAYRPDPVAEALRDLPTSPLCVGMHWVLSGPVGLDPLPRAAIPLIVDVRLSGGPTRGPRHRIRNVVAVRARTSRYDPLFPLQALSDLRDLQERGDAEVLDLEPCLGSDLLAPAQVEAILGAIREPLPLPHPWQTLPNTRSSVRLGTWSESLRVILEVFHRVRDEVIAESRRLGMPTPETPVRLVALRGTSDDWSASFIVDLRDAAGLDRFSAAVETTLSSIQPPSRSVLSGSLRVGGPVLSHPGRVVEMGPLEDDVLADPAGAARRAADAYVKVVSRLIAER